VADRPCKRIFAALSDYLDGDLPARNCRELKRHLKDCQPCLAYLDTLKTTIKACQKYAVEQAPPSPRVRAVLLEALRKPRK
jgi:anti-sigma factor RsiW